MKVKETATAYLTKHRRFTYQDYLGLPEDGKRYEVIRGELQMTPAPSINHQRVSGELEKLLRIFVAENNLGEVFDSPVDVLLEDTVVLQPDILFISTSNSYLIQTEEIAGAPDLVIEILSPATEYRDQVEKKALYEKHGVSEYWIVNPIKKWIEIFLNKNGRFDLAQRAETSEAMVKSVIIPGFAVKCSEIFTQV